MLHMIANNILVLLLAVAFPFLSQEPPPQQIEPPIEEPLEPASPEEPTRPSRRPGVLPLAVVAEIDLRAQTVGPALYYRSSLIVATELGEVLSLDAKTGGLLWKLGFPGAELLPPRLLPQGVLVATRSGTVFLLESETGEIQFEEPTGVSILLPPSWRESVLFLATPESEIVAFDIEEMREIWRSQLTDLPLAMSVGGNLLAVSDRSGGLHALDAETGRLRWQFQGRGNFESPAAFDDRGQRLFLGDTGGYFYSLSADNGKVQYRWATGAAIPLPPRVEEDRLFLASYANTLFCYRLGNGHELWRANLPGRPAFAPVRVRRRVVVVTLDGKVAEYASGGQAGTPIYAAPEDILPAPTFTLEGMSLPLRSGKLLLLQTRRPAPTSNEPEGSTGNEEESDELDDFDEPDA